MSENEWKYKLETLLKALEFQNVEDIMVKSKDEIRYIGEYLIYTYKINMGMICDKPILPNVKIVDVDKILFGGNCE